MSERSFGEQMFPVLKKGDNEKSIEKEKEPEASAHFIRHSIARYQAIGKIKNSENPQAPFDRDDQPYPDLAEPGIELADKKAEEFLSRFDPNKDALIFFSSDEGRAIETANIFRLAAKDKGFEIIKHQRPETKKEIKSGPARHELTQEVGEGEIRTLNSLSLHVKNILASSVFNMNEGTINWEAAEKQDPKVRSKWEAARKIISDGGDQGSWGANFFKYSEQIQEIFPDVKSARDLYMTQFNNLARLIKVGIEKSKESGSEKNIRILGFGHENYFVQALSEYMKDHALGNCESVDFELEDDVLVMKKDGEAVRLEAGKEKKN